MPVLSNGAHVLKFVMAELGPSWDSFLGPDNVLYQATSNEAQLAVVHEGPSGALTTYFYLIDLYAAKLQYDVAYRREWCETAGLGFELGELGYKSEAPIRPSLVA